jgi:hypothetical protein
MDLTVIQRPRRPLTGQLGSELSPGQPAGVQSARSQTTQDGFEPP